MKRRREIICWRVVNFRSGFTAWFDLKREAIEYAQDIADEIGEEVSFERHTIPFNKDALLFALEGRPIIGARYTAEGCLCIPRTPK